MSKNSRPPTAIVEFKVDVKVDDDERLGGVLERLVALRTLTDQRHAGEPDEVDNVRRTGAHLQITPSPPNQFFIPFLKQIINCATIRAVVPWSKDAWPVREQSGTKPAAERPPCPPSRRSAPSAARRTCAPASDRHLAPGKMKHEP